MSRIQKLYRLAQLSSPPGSRGACASPLRDTGDDFPKLLLTLDTVQPDDFAGIRHVRVPDFLLSDPLRPAGA